MLGLIECTLFPHVLPQWPSLVAGIRLAPLAEPQSPLMNPWGLTAACGCHWRVSALTPSGPRGRRVFGGRTQACRLEGCLMDRKSGPKSDPILSLDLITSES